MKLYTLNLTKGFNPIHSVIDITHETFTFHGGEPHIKIKDQIVDQSTIAVTIKLNTFNDMGTLYVAMDALRRHVDNCRYIFFIPYLPAARQDRVMVSGEPFTAKVIAHLINELHFDQVLIFDPHSDVGPALINNSKVLTNHNFVSTSINKLELTDYHLISPDAGSNKKMFNLCEYLQKDNFIRADKHRDVSTGKLTSFEVYAEDLQNKPCIVVDDICDGGGTFIGLAEELKNKNAGDLYLIVSHGIFSKGLTELKKHYKKIITTDSWTNLKEDGRLIINELSILL